MWGDPHFRSVDNKTFTFNGIGDYILLRSPSNNFTVQARFTRYDETTQATVMTALAVKQGTSQIVVVEIRNGSLQVNIDNEAHDIPNNNVVLVTENAESIETLPSDFSSVDSNVISFYYMDGELILNAASGGSLTVMTQMMFLRTTVELTDDFLNETEGLLGFYNNDPDDDFRLPNGSVLSPNLTEEEIYHQFGLSCESNHSISNLGCGLVTNKRLSTFVTK